VITLPLLVLAEYAEDDDDAVEEENTDADADEESIDDEYWIGADLVMLVGLVQFLQSLLYRRVVGNVSCCCSCC